MAQQILKEVDGSFKSFFDLHKIEKLIKQNERQGITDYTYRIFDRLERCYLKTLVSY